jgi:HlyD family secretion protein/epimerase transport system membrane fusion protein
MTIQLPSLIVPSQVPAPTVDPILNTDTRGPIRLGLILIVVFFGGFGTWAALAPLDSAATAPGFIAVDTSRKTVQHLEGGIIDEILVAEGDRVEAGQVLVRLDETRSRAAFDVLESQYLAELAAEARLRTEQKGGAEIDFGERVMAAASDPTVADIISGQRGMFETRRKALDAQIGILTQGKAQAEQEIEGNKAQQQAKKTQLALILEEHKAVKELYEKGYEKKPRVLALQRAAAVLKGEIALLESNVAATRQQIGESDFRILSLRDVFEKDVATELRETQKRIAELEDRVKTQADVLRRIDIVAPQAGTVVGLRFHTAGGVVSPGAPLLDIVPSADRLVVEARVRPDDIDVVHEGLPAQVRLTAYMQRTTPYVEGTVTQVSADHIIDEQTGVAYFKVRVEIDATSLAELDDVDLYPGMPVDVMIKTGERTALDYMLAPITGSMYRAFREQ